MIERLRDESGWAVVIATVLVTVMVGVGLAALAIVDNQQKQSGNERQRESSLNLNEGVLYGQGFVLTQLWPNASNPYPASCSSAVGAGTFCPNRDQLAAATSTNPALANFTTPDFLKNATWTTKVRDNGGQLSTVYDPNLADQAQSGILPATATQPATNYTCAAPCTYDANQDHKMWVEAKTVVNGHPRVVVAQLQLELLTEDVPKVVMQAGHFKDSNNGWHGGSPIVNGDGSPILLRCDVTDTTSCDSYRTSGSQTQVSPTPTQMPAGQDTYMSPTELERLKDRAKADNTYYPGCPTKGSDNQYHLEGAVVWVENCDGMSFQNNIATVPCPAGMPAVLSAGNCINTPSSPGLLIWHAGHVSFTGNAIFNGLIYAVNNSDSITGEPGPFTDDVVTTNGTFGVYGGIAVDLNGGLNLGSSGGQLFFNPNAFVNIQSYGTAGLVQNTWRELPPNSP